MKKIQIGIPELTKKDIEMIKASVDMPILYDEDCPELTEEQLKGFKHVSELKERERRTYS